MHRKVLAGLIGLLLTSAPLHASDVGFNINLSLGNQPAPRVVRAVPVVIQEPPMFLYPPQLGFAVAIGIPYDVVYLDGRYYLYDDDIWHVSSRYNGPWQRVKHKHLPPGLRKHKYREIVEYREREYVVYRGAGHDDHYRGKVHHPGREKHKRKHKHDDDD
ncbi:MAG: hypothetical protein ACYDAI_17515 [Trichloromonadaceae bacterium]